MVIMRVATVSGAMRGAFRSEDVDGFEVLSELFNLSTRRTKAKLVPSDFWKNGCARFWIWPSSGFLLFLKYLLDS